MNNLVSKLFASARLAALAGLICFVFTAFADAQVINAPAGSKTGILAADTFRPLRYRPDGSDFVIENGGEFFNRPLYGGNTAFRVDAGDKPEFLLYLPGRGGNLRFGIATARGAKWLLDADRVVARYRPGSMIYEISDRLLGGGRVLRLTAIAAYDREGLLVRAELLGPAPAARVELVWAYGGASGERGRRDGDIGTENVPIGQFFQYRPEVSKDDRFALAGSSFTLDGKTARIAGVMPRGSSLTLADGANWSDIETLTDAAALPAAAPVLVGRLPLRANAAEYFSFQRTAAGAQAPTTGVLNETLQAPADVPAGQSAAAQSDELPRIFADSEAARAAVAARVSVETPDPFVNAAAAALNIGADAVWDEPQGAFMHGAIAWRQKLLGWRGPYLGDALGWHARMRRHLEYWATRQNRSVILDGPVTPDASVNYARNEPALHSNGDMSNSHYDMNAVYIDELFRHLLWTGDVEFARRMFPVIERHLAWERRLFRREFGADRLPLYEAYVMIWASDDLQYNGGGVAHASAYNYFHNKMAARIATMIGADAAPYEREADLILTGMHRRLWLPERGWFGEYKDLLGRGIVHQNAALWTFYHAVDSGIPTPEEAWQTSRFVDTQIPHLPIRGKGVPDEDLATVSTTSWMPYTWSTNNVVMAEVMHTSLGYWQAGRPDEAFRLYKAAILDSMFIGICPGNVGSMTFLDANRRESQRDFADPSGTTSRAMIEGLFGVRPDLLAGELVVRPGFSAAWNFARLRHPDLDISFARRGLSDSYRIAPKFARPLRLRLEVAAARDGIATVTVNGRRADWKSDPESVGRPVVVIAADGTREYDVEIVWKGRAPGRPLAPAVVAADSRFDVRAAAGMILSEVSDPQSAIRDGVRKPGVFSAVAAPNFGHRTIFARVRQGAMAWRAPVMFEVRPALEIVPVETQHPDALRFRLRNNTPRPVDESADFDVAGGSERRRLNVAAYGESDVIALAPKTMSPGSNAVAVRLADGRAANGVVQNWRIASAAASRFESVHLGGVFNDWVAEIFKHEYLSPRSPFVSLAVPKQGIGSWVHFNETFDVDDGGLRRLADRTGGRLTLPNGVPLETTGTGGGKNIAFASQWDNFPREITVPLSGAASKVYLLMAGSTNQMQSRFDNGEVVVAYADGTTARLALENPTNWWPIDQDYMIDDYAFRRPEAIPPRVDLRTGEVRILDLSEFKTKGRKVPGGAATVLDLPLDPAKQLKSLAVRALANEVVIGLMSATLMR